MQFSQSVLWLSLYLTAGDQQALHTKWRPTRSQGVLMTHRQNAASPSSVPVARRPGRVPLPAVPTPLTWGAAQACFSGPRACLSSAAGRSQDARFPQNRQGGHQRGQGVRVHAAEEVRTTPARAGRLPGSLQGVPRVPLPPVWPGSRTATCRGHIVTSSGGPFSSIPKVSWGGQWFVKLPRLETVRK